jgi:alpha-glucosidase
MKLTNHVAAVGIPLLLAAVPRSAAAALHWAGAATSCSSERATIDCSLNGGGRIRIDLYADDVVRMRLSPEAVFRDRPTGALVSTAMRANSGHVLDAGSAVLLVSPRVTVELLKSPLRVIIWRADGSLISVDQENAVGWDTATGVVFTRKIAFPGEQFLGLGERGGPINRRGRRLTMRNTDWAGFTASSDPLYLSIPFFYSFREGKAAGIYVDSGATPFFEFDPGGDGVLTFGVLAGDLDYYVMAGPEPVSVARGYRQLTGPNQLPPLWTLGYHQSRYSYVSQDEVLSTARLLRTLEIPADVLYFDIDYLDRLRMFTWNQAAFPSPDTMNTLLKTWGFRSVNIMEPINRTDDPLHGFLAQSDFYLHGSGGQLLINQIWYGLVSWLDFSRTAARNWYKDALKSFLSTYVIDGVWNDLNEPAQNFMPEAVYNFDGEPRTDLEARNLYALLMAKTSFEAQRELRPSVRPWIFSRSGFAGLHRYGANWGGDAESSFASLRANVEITVSMGLSGQPFFGHDIGGFLGSPSPELFLRWLTFSAYTPLFRNHATNTSARREPWAFGEPYLSMARNIINDRYRLIPYIYSLFHHDAVRAEPVIAPLPFHFPSDALTYVINDQFLLGPSLLVAPIDREGETGRWVYLPAGADWIDQRTDLRTEGGSWVFATAGIGEIPVFVRDGAIVPRAPAALSTGAQPLNRRSLDVYCGVPASFELYDDDGNSFDYETGGFLTSTITCTPGTATTIRIERTSGLWHPPADRTWWAHVHRVAVKPSSVSKMATALPIVPSETALETVPEGWTYTSDQRVIVKIQDQPTPLSVSILP